MRGLQRTSLLLLVLLFALDACELPGISLTVPGDASTLAAETLMAAIAATQSAVPQTPATATQTATPTFTLTITSTPTETLTPTPSATPFPFQTPTPLVPTLSVSVPTNCRTGPGKAYELVGALLVGETAQVYARDPTGMYWYIPNPDAPGELCWVWGQYATVSGFVSLLPVYTPLPTPSPTLTPTPAPAFTASYDGLVSCPGAWWAQIKLKNTGLITFQSIGMILKDTVTSESVADISDDFTDRKDCSTSTSKDSLQPAKTLTVSTPELGADPTGHKLRLTITVCSQDGQNGFCLTQTISFKP